jgi:hypothetical protein
MKRPSSRDDGVALVVTVIVVAMLAVVGVALMQSVTADRAASRSVANYARAQLAAEAGAGMAGALLASQMTNDHFIVVANTNRQLFVGNGVTNPPTSTDFSYVPAFSTVNSVTSAVTPIVSAGVPVTNPPAGPNTTNFTFTNLPGGLSVTSPTNISWVYLTTTNAAGQTVTNARFAFWVEDLGGRLDLSVVGAKNAGDPSARRPTGTNPAEIASWSVFNPNSTSDPGNAIATSLVSARSNLLTAATARLVNPSVTPDFLKDLAAGLRHDTNEPELIPFGFGYADQGKPKFDLNTNVTSGVASIASKVTANLPQFAANRAGGMAPATYLNYLAANIVDYADANSSPTSAGGAQGDEAAVYLNELFDRFFWKQTVEEGEQRSVKIDVTTYMELWNPTDQRVQGQLVIEIDATEAQISVNGADRKLADKPWTLQQVIDFRPNEYKVLEMTREVTLPWGPTPPPANATLPLPATEINYSVALNGADIDKSVKGYGLERTVSPTGVRFNQPLWKGNAMVADSDLAFGRVGDPRMNAFITYQRRGHSYVGRSSWGGRNRMPQLMTNSFGEVKKWYDGTFVTNSPAGISATADAQLPTDLAKNAVYYSNAPVKLNNTGTITNIFELGNIFDPVQWRVDLTTAGDISSGSGATASALGGGGNTLRVGRGEHPRFTNDGSRASQLLDIFAAGAAGSGGVVVNRSAGRININTAGTNALRALVAGVYHNTDPAISPANLVVQTNAVGAFVDAVGRFRSQRPFFSPSQLTLLATNTVASAWPTNAVFGNRSLAGANEWNDSAAEEWLSRVYALSAVRSRNFIVYVVGQSLQPGATNTTASTVRSAYQLYVEPVRDSGTGLSTNAIIRIVNSWSL